MVAPQPAGISRIPVTAKVATFVQERECVETVETSSCSVIRKRNAKCKGERRKSQGLAILYGKQAVSQAVGPLADPHATNRPKETGEIGRPREAAQRVEMHAGLNRKRLASRRRLDDAEGGERRV